MSPRVRAPRSGSPATAPLPGEIHLAGLDVGPAIGHGAGSTVYRVSREGVAHALKILHMPAIDTQAALARLRREAALLAGADDPRLPAVHEIGQIDGRPYLVMDLFEGQSLADLLRAGRLDPARAIRLCRDVVGPLATMHSTGVVHRDLKPDNIMVLDDGSARLIDFGLAAFTQPESDESGPASFVVGTLAYASAEQAGTLRRPVDHRSDLYSLGVVLFECLTGTLPFPTNDVGELLRLHATQPAPDPRSLAPVGPGLAAVVNRLLAKDPDDRYQSGEELAGDLGRLAGDPGADLPAGPEALRAGAERSPAGPRSRLCGRHTERSALEEHWRRAQAGDPTTCVLTGSTGIGLTRLAQEVSELARRDGATVLNLACRDDDPLPFGPLRAAIDRWLGEVAALPAERRAAEHERIRTAAEAVGGGSRLAHLSPRLAELLACAVLPASNGQDGYAAAASSFLVELARSGPGMLIVIDDAPLLDAGSARVLARLIAGADRPPLLTLATVCTDRADLSVVSRTQPWLQEGVDEIVHLQPLDDEDVVELVTIRLPGVQVESALARLFTQRCQGNPLIVIEYVRAIVDAGLLNPHWGTWILDEERLNALELSADVLGLVEARIEHLDDAARRVLTIAAVIGSSFPVEVLADVARIDVDRVAAALALAVTEQLVAPETGSGYRFVHAKIRGALLDAVDEAELTRLHQAVAEAYEGRYRTRPEGSDQADQLVFSIASHYLAARPRPGGERAALMWKRAGQLALAGHAPAEAVPYLEAATSVPAADPELHLLLGTAYAREGRFGRARSRLDTALDVEPDPVGRARILLLISELERDRWDNDAAWLAADQGLAELGRRIPAAPAAQALGALLRTVLGLVMFLCRRGGKAVGAARSRAAVRSELHRVAGYLAIINGRPDLNLMHSLYAIPSLSRLGCGPEYALGLGSLGCLARILGLNRLGERLLRPAERAAAEAGDPRLRATVEWYRALSAYLGGADDGESWQQALDRHSEWFHAGEVAAAIASFVWQAAALGQITQSRSWFDRSHRLVARSDWTSTALPISSAVVKTAEGRPAEAATELNQIDAASGAGTPASFTVILLLARLHALVEQGEFGQPFDDVVAQYATIGPKPAQTSRQLRIFLMHRAVGRLAQWRTALEQSHGAAAVAQARTLARQAVRDVTRTATAPNETAFAQLAAAELALLGGRPDRALRLLGRILPVRQAAPILEYDRARCTARALAATGHPVDARRHARIAVMVARDAGLVRRGRDVAQEFALDSSLDTGQSTATGSVTTSASDLLPFGADRLRLDALQEISLVASTVLDPDELARICLDRTLRILSAERAVLFLTPDSGASTSDRQPLAPYIGRDDQGCDVGELTGYSASLVERVRATGELVVVTGTEEGAALGAQSVVLHGLRSIMVAPLQLEGRMLGVVYLDSQVARGIFTAEDAGILTALTTHIATALETARAAKLEVSMRTAQQQRDLAEKLRGNQVDLASALEPDDVLDRLSAAVPALLPGVDAILLRPGSPELDDGELRDLMDRHESVTEATAAPAALRRRLPADAAWSLHRLVAAERSVGLLVIHTRDVGNLSDADVELVKVLIGQAMTAFERATLFSRVQELAVMDELTGIPNRRRFFEVSEPHLAAARAHDRTVHALMIDIDHFKRVNDTFGHPVGDEVIRAVAQRLRRQTRETDIIGRYGGEEFALVSSDVAVATGLAERLRSTVNGDPVQTAAGPLPITVSIGVAAAQASDTGVADVLARADAALYEAKRAGRNRVVAS